MAVTTNITIKLNKRKKRKMKEIKRTNKPRATASAIDPVNQEMVCRQTKKYMRVAPYTLNDNMAAYSSVMLHSGTGPDTRYFLMRKLSRNFPVVGYFALTWC